MLLSSQQQLMHNTEHLTQIALLRWANVGTIYLCRMGQHYFPTLVQCIFFSDSQLTWTNVGIKHRQLWPIFTVGRMSYKYWSNVEAISCRITLSQRSLSEQNYVGPTLENRWKIMLAQLWLLKAWSHECRISLRMTNECHFFSMRFMLV